MKRFALTLSPVLLVIASSLPALAETAQPRVPQTRIEQQLQNSQLGPWLKQTPPSPVFEGAGKVLQISTETAQQQRSQQKAPQTRIEQQLQNSQLGPWQR